ncbi:hypothetical protein HYALB_00003150 [Hymenoscyphus albidus]|uniref:Dihydroneopterin aldolase/epimerase domain-containing protein n=1 Tax=Hymenoscyphus albidus TaxID=595503 RepID=A0A9N9LFI1_9HELO|nr:hypothetical protein HYALB_00003150 [Hymenoscyphus albidus]
MDLDPPVIEERFSLLPSWELQSLVGQPPAKIHVRNLQTSMKIARDAWGRYDKEQPVLVSVAVSLRHAFESASAQDEVTNSTVHYGTLSKAVLEACRYFSDTPTDLYPREEKKEATALSALVTLIGVKLIRSNDEEAETHKHLGRPLLTPSAVTCLEVRVMLPKSSLLGSRVSLTLSTFFGPQIVRVTSFVLSLHDLKIPTLIGVNPNERLAKQLVIANVCIEQWDHLPDSYNELEQVVSKTIEESSFRTLESLAKHLGERIISCFIIPYTRTEAQNSEDTWVFPCIKICLEKPTAVTFADAPMVEAVVYSHPEKNEYAKALWLESAAGADFDLPPFPLQGSLGEWVASNR